MQINHALEVASILRHNIVQGARDAEDENAKWGAYLPELVGSWFSIGRMEWEANDCICLELRIHDEIERGDNDSIKVAGKKVKVDKPCSS
jgi:hypothetical protein